MGKFQLDTRSIKHNKREHHQVHRTFWGAFGFFSFLTLRAKMFHARTGNDSDLFSLIKNVNCTKVAKHALYFFGIKINLVVISIVCRRFAVASIFSTCVKT